MELNLDQAAVRHIEDGALAISRRSRYTQPYITIPCAMTISIVRRLGARQGRTP